RGGDPARPIPWSDRAEAVHRPVQGDPEAVTRPDDAHRELDLLARPRLEIVPLRSGAEEWPFLPTDGVVTITCSPHRGVDATLDLAEELTGRGLSVTPHLAAKTVRSREHLVEVLDRVRRSGMEDVFVIG